MFYNRLQTNEGKLKYLLRHALNNSYLLALINIICNKPFVWLGKWYDKDEVSIFMDQTLTEQFRFEYNLYKPL